MNHTKAIQQEKGQLLIEMLVALLVGGIFLLGATLGVSSLLRYSFESRGNQVASSFAAEMLSDVESFTDAQWHNIYDLDKGIVNAYYLIPHPTSTVAVKGEESMLFVDVTAGRAGHWKFDELSGDIAYDSSGNFINATSTSFPTRVESSQCQVGACLDFNGTSSFMSAGNQSVFDLVNEGSVSVWVKIPSSWAGGTYPNVVSKGAAYGWDTDGWSLYMFQDNRIGIGFRNGATTNTLDFTNTIKDEWTHIVGTWDGSTMNIYQNGVLKNTRSQTITPATTTVALEIGRGMSHYFDGLLDDVRIYNRGLSEQEIKNLYEAALYTRYFYIDNVSRDISGNIVTTGGEDDPATQKITVGVDWEGGRNMRLVEYTTRNNPQNYMQTDWTGGSGVAGPVTSATSTYFDASNVNTASYSLQLASTTISGWLESATFDTQIEGGARLNNILWQGSKPSGTVVKFQLAYAATSTGPWSFVGDDGTGNSYFTPATSDIALKLEDIHNYRYFRYKVFLEPASGTSPIIDDIFINWTK